MWLLNLDFAGGSVNPTQDSGWISVPAEQETIFVQVGSPSNMRKIRYLDAGSGLNPSLRQHIDFTDWLDGATLNTVAWSARPTGVVTFTNSSNTNQVASTQINANSASYGQEYRITCTVTPTEASGSIQRKYPFSFMLHIVDGTP